MIYLVQDNLMYDNRPFGIVDSQEQPQFNPVELPVEEVFINSEKKVVLHCWIAYPYGYHDSHFCPTLILFPGNAGTVRERLQLIKHLVSSLEVNVLIISYRGYGNSTASSPSELGLKRDGVASIEYLLNNRQNISTSIFLFGRSLGGAVAIHVAKHYQDKIKGVILENTFTDVPSILNSQFPYLTYFKFLCTNTWNSCNEIKSISNTPVLFLSAQNDEIIPPKMMEILHKNCPSHSRAFKSFANANHLTADTNAHDYFPTIKTWIRSCMMK